MSELANLPALTAEELDELEAALTARLILAVARVQAEAEARALAPVGPYEAAPAWAAVVRSLLTAVREARLSLR